ncbi:hypothetical protein HK102_008423 [Quaeritorhiza haematococci]|nr:hypothetical protein HK102_008423 [Quaeritorhiza haematococci]
MINLSPISITSPGLDSITIAAAAAVAKAASSESGDIEGQDSTGVGGGEKEKGGRSGMGGSSTSLVELYQSLETPREKRAVRRWHVLVELLETERAYVADLRMLVENCFDRLNAASWLPLEKKYILIRNANDLFKFQQEFLARMEAVMEAGNISTGLSSIGMGMGTGGGGVDEWKGGVEVPIGKVFVEMEERFKVYTHYCTQHDGAVRILSELEKKPEMVTFLQELIKNTEDDSPHMEDLLWAHTVMQNVAADIDSAKWYIENLQRTDRFFQRLEGAHNVEGAPLPHHHSHHPSSSSSTTSSSSSSSRAGPTFASVPILPLPTGGSAPRPAGPAPSATPAVPIIPAPAGRGPMTMTMAAPAIAGVGTGRVPAGPVPGIPVPDASKGAGGVPALPPLPPIGGAAKGTATMMAPATATTRLQRRFLRFARKGF